MELFSSCGASQAAPTPHAYQPHNSTPLLSAPQTTPTQTCYYAKVFEKDVPKALEILADILQVGGAHA